MTSHADETPRACGARDRERVSTGAGLVQLRVVLVAAGSGDHVRRDQQSPDPAGMDQIVRLPEFSSLPGVGHILM